MCNRARLNVALLDELDLVNRTAELAKTFGIDWHSVVSRGSQYRVESMLARLAHTQNYLLVRAPAPHTVCTCALAVPVEMLLSNAVQHSAILLLSTPARCPRVPD